MLFPQTVKHVGVLAFLEAIPLPQNKTLVLLTLSDEDRDPQLDFPALAEYVLHLLYNDDDQAKAAGWTSYPGSVAWGKVTTIWIQLEGELRDPRGFVRSQAQRIRQEKEKVFDSDFAVHSVHVGSDFVVHDQRTDFKINSIT